MHGIKSAFASALASAGVVKIIKRARARARAHRYIRRVQLHFRFYTRLADNIGPGQRSQHGARTGELIIIPWRATPRRTRVPIYNPAVRGMLLGR